MKYIYRFKILNQKIGEIKRLREYSCSGNPLECRYFYKYHQFVYQFLLIFHEQFDEVDELGVSASAGHLCKLISVLNIRYGTC